MGCGSSREQEDPSAPLLHGILRVHVIAAQDLPDTDNIFFNISRGDLTDPYLELRLAGHSVLKTWSAYKYIRKTTRIKKLPTFGLTSFTSLWRLETIPPCPPPTPTVKDQAIQNSYSFYKLRNIKNVQFENRPITRSKIVQKFLW